ncbi:MAG: acyl-CoA thioesterase [Beijerinckiaceae bacterium]
MRIRKLARRVSAVAVSTPYLDRHSSHRTNLVSAPIANHCFDRATHLERTGSGLRGATSDAYWAFVGPFGGVTTATLLRAVLEDEDRAGDPLAITVNFCAPISRGSFDVFSTLSRANRSTQHWSMQLSQAEGALAATATAILAVRRPGFSHQPARRPDVASFETIPAYPTGGMATWVQRYEFRFAEGAPVFGPEALPEPGSAVSRCWIRDVPPRPLDFLSLAALSDTFFGRIFHVRGTMLPFGTVSLTTYFHADAADLARQGDGPILAVADASVFHKSYCDQKGELWSQHGQLLATCHQIAYFRDG